MPNMREAGDQMPEAKQTTTTAQIPLMEEASEERELQRSIQPGAMGQRSPLAAMRSRLGDEASATMHASMLSRMADTGSHRSGHALLLQLQRQYGNRYVRRVVSLSRQESSPQSVPAPVEDRIQQARGGGHPLDNDARGQMEKAFGADFGGVHVHTDAEADMLSRSLNARAFATGQDIFFRQGAYDPGSTAGRELLAHELTHVVQQNGSKVQAKLTVSSPGDRFEQEADQVARAIIQQEQMPATQPSSATTAIDPEAQQVNKDGSEEALKTKPVSREIHRQPQEEEEVAQRRSQPSRLLRQEQEEESVQAKVARVPVQRQADNEQEEIAQEQAEAPSIQRFVEEKEQTTSQAMPNLAPVRPDAQSGNSPLMTAEPTSARNPKKASLGEMSFLPKAVSDLLQAPGMTKSAPVAAEAQKAPKGAESASDSSKTASVTGQVETKAGDQKQPAEGEAAEAEAPEPAEMPLEKDPRFQGVIKRLEKTARRERDHEDKSVKVAEAKAAVVQTPNDRSREAQHLHAEAMGVEAEKPTKELNQESFLSILEKQLKTIAPDNMEEMEEFKKSGQVETLKGGVTKEVRQQKTATEQGIKGVTTAEADASKIPEEKAAEIEEQTDKPAAALQAEAIVPLPKSEAAISVKKNKDSAEQLMEENDIDEKQLEEAKEPLFDNTLKSKQELDKHADEVPALYRSEEEKFMTEAKTEAKAEEKDAVRQMRAGRNKSKRQVRSRQDNAKSEIEKARKNVADTIQGMYLATKLTVGIKLALLEVEVNNLFDQGEKQARTQFENDVDRKMSSYKYDRYSQIGGGFLWAKDKLFDLPKEVDKFYEDGKKQYLEDMHKVFIKIADTVELRLAEAKSAITDGKTKIRNFVKGLGNSVSKAGADAEREIGSQFEELEQSVEDKKADLARKLAQKAQEARNKLDERIKELKAANKGLLSGFIDKIKEIIKILADFRDRITALLQKSAGVIREIIKHPIKFLKNLLGAVKLGFNQFVNKIDVHLKKGLLEWLFGMVSGTGVEIPNTFTPQSILGLILQILGITVENIRAKVVKLVGAKNVARFEKAWAMVSTLISQGPGALWDMAKEYLTGLQERIMGEVGEWLITEIIKQGIFFVASLFNPISALIRAIQMIYNVVMFFIENIERILKLVEAVVESVAKIVMGDIAGAADWIEQAMGRMVPVIIGFLARMLNLGGISAKVKSIIDKVRKPINQAIDKVLAVIVGKIKGALGKVKTGAKNVKDAVVKFLFPKKVFQAGGETHTLYFDKSGAGQKLFISSDPKTIHAFLSNMEKQTAKMSKSQVDSLKAAKTLVDEKIEPLAKRIQNAKTAAKDKNLKSKQGDTLFNDMLTHEVNLSKLITIILGKRVTKATELEIYKLEGLTGTYAGQPKAKGDNFTPDHQPQASALQYAAALPYFADEEKGQKMVEHARSRAAMGATIFLHKNRHEAGRTYGGKGGGTVSKFKDKVEEVTSKLTSNAGKRKAVVKLLKVELAADVEWMKDKVLNRTSKDPVWQDINKQAKKLNLEVQAKEELINKTKEQILRGEEILAAQDLDSLAG